MNIGRCFNIFGLFFQILLKILQFLLQQVVHLNLFFLCNQSQSLIIVPLTEGIVEEIVLPGAVNLGALLLVQGLGVVQAEVGQVVAVVAQEALDTHPVVDLKLADGQILVAGGSGDHVPGSQNNIVADGVGLLGVQGIIGVNDDILLVVAGSGGGCCCSRRGVGILTASAGGQRKHRTKCKSLWRV